MQCAAATLLEAGEEVQRQIRERTAANLSLARELLRGSPASILSLEGGWYITLQVPRVRSEEQWVLDLLESEHVLVQPGFNLRLEALCREGGEFAGRQESISGRHWATEEIAVI